MATAKRLYLYAVSGLGLALGLSGAVMLLQTLLANVGFGPSGHSADADKLAFANALGLMVAGLLVWLIHWTIVERMVAGAKDDAALAERRSIVRSVYFASVLAVTLYVTVSQAATWLGRIVADVVDAKPLAGASSVLDAIGGQLGLTVSSGAINMGGADDSSALAIILVMGAAWAYHAWIRDRDLSLTPLISGAAAWVSRFYLYGAALVSLIISLDFIVHFARIIIGEWAEVPAMAALDKATGQGSVPYGEDWVRPVIVSVVAVAVWGAVWASHWLYSVRLRTGSGQQAAAERGSRTRLAFMALVILWAAATVILFVGQSAGNILGLLVGVKYEPVPLWYVVIVPVIAAVPAAVAGWWYREQALAEDGGVANVSAARLILYVIALAGIYYLTQAATAFLTTLFVQVFTTRGADAWKPGAAAGLGLAVAAAVVWGWAWIQAQQRRAANWQSESVTSSRNYYLYLVLGVAVANGAMALALLVEKYSAILLSLKNEALGSQVSPQLAIAIVAAVVIGYHWWILRLDKYPPAPKAVAAVATPAKPAARAAAPAKPAAKAPAKKPAAKAPAKKPAAKKPAK